MRKAKQTNTKMAHNNATELRTVAPITLFQPCCSMNANINTCARVKPKTPTQHRTAILP